MLCSNCRTGETGQANGGQIVATCEFGHFICSKCKMETGETTCPVCYKLLLEENLMNKSIIISKSISSQMDVDEDIPTRFLYNRAREYKADSIAQSFDNMMGCMWNESTICTTTSLYTKDEKPSQSRGPTQTELQAGNNECSELQAESDAIKNVDINIPSLITNYSDILQQIKDGKEEMLLQTIKLAQLEKLSFQENNAKIVRPKMNPIGVSTGSSPCLAEMCDIGTQAEDIKPPIIEGEGYKKQDKKNNEMNIPYIKPTEYTMMQIDTSEGPHLCKLVEQNQKEKSPKKSLTEQSIGELQIEKKPTKQPEEFIKNPKKVIEQPQTNAWRAHYIDPKTWDLKIKPEPQYQLISPVNKNSTSKYEYKPYVIDATEINLPRSPVICPISECQRPFFLTDFTKHIIVNHCKVLIECVEPLQCNHFFLDPNLVHSGVNRCHILLLLKNRIKNLGHEEYKDFIPILLMTTKIKISDLCITNCESSPPCDLDMQSNFMMIWLTGVELPQSPIYTTTTVFSRSGSVPMCHLVYSGRLYPVRNPQDWSSVHKSGLRLLISEHQVNLLTNRNRHLIEIQISLQ